MKGWHRIADDLDADWISRLDWDALLGPWLAVWVLTVALAWTEKLKPLVGKRVEKVLVDDYGVVYITAADPGSSRIVVKIGAPPHE